MKYPISKNVNEKSQILISWLDYYSILSVLAVVGSAANFTVLEGKDITPAVAVTPPAAVVSNTSTAGSTVVTSQASTTPSSTPGKGGVSPFCTDLLC